MRVFRLERLSLLFAALLAVSACIGIPGQGPAASQAAAESRPAAPSPAAPASPPPKAGAPAREESPLPEGDFYKANIASLASLRLENGVSVYIKRNPANRVFALKVVIKGGSALTPPEKAGVEALTLQVMARGSKRYDYDALAAMAYYRSSAIAAAGSSYDYSTFDLVTFDKYFDETFDAYADCFMEPTLLESDFRTALAAMKASLAKTMSDPYGYATGALHQAAFKGHPYAADPQGTEESLSALTLADVKDCYASLAAADRLAIVAVGNFDEDKLLGQLNAAFGKLPRKGVAIPETKRREARRDLILAPFPASPGVAYVRGDYPAPRPSDKDWTAFALSSTILSDLLFSVVRNKYGACYTPISNAYGFNDSYGTIGIYKTSKPAEVKLFIDEAISILAEGRSPNIKKVPGVEYAELKDTLESYKAKYVNAFYSSQQTNIEVAAQIAASVSAYGRPDEYLRVMDKVKAVKAEDVTRAVKKYLVEGKIQWIVVTDQAGLDSVRRDDWLSFQSVKK